MFIKWRLTSFACCDFMLGCYLNGELPFIGHTQKWTIVNSLINSAAALNHSYYPYLIQKLSSSPHGLQSWEKHSYYFKTTSYFSFKQDPFGDLFRTKPLIYSPFLRVIYILKHCRGGLLCGSVEGSVVLTVAPQQCGICCWSHPAFNCQFHAFDAILPIIDLLCLLFSCCSLVTNTIFTPVPSPLLFSPADPSSLSLNLYQGTRLGEIVELTIFLSLSFITPSFTKLFTFKPLFLIRLFNS